MGEVYDRLEALRQIIDDMLRGQPDDDERRAGFVHLYGVAQAAGLLALRRGLDVQVAMAAGMLHDLATYRSGESANHATRGAELAREVLAQVRGWSAEDVDAITTAIARHMDKAAVDGPLDELLKDADVLQHLLYNPAIPVYTDAPEKRARLAQVVAELGLAR